MTLDHLTFLFALPYTTLFHLAGAYVVGTGYLLLWPEDALASAISASRIPVVVFAGAVLSTLVVRTLGIWQVAAMAAHLSLASAAWSTKCDMISRHGVLLSILIAGAFRDIGMFSATYLSVVLCELRSSYPNIQVDDMLIKTTLFPVISCLLLQPRRESWRGATEEDSKPAKLRSDAARAADESQHISRTAEPEIPSSSRSDSAGTWKEGASKLAEAVGRVMYPHSLQLSIDVLQDGVPVQDVEMVLRCSGNGLLLRDLVGEGAWQPLISSLQSSANLLLSKQAASCELQSFPVKLPCLGNRRLRATSAKATVLSEFEDSGDASPGREDPAASDESLLLKVELTGFKEGKAKPAAQGVAGAQQASASSAASAPAGGAATKWSSLLLAAARSQTGAHEKRARGRTPTLEPIQE